MRCGYSLGESATTAFQPDLSGCCSIIGCFTCWRLSNPIWNKFTNIVGCRITTFPGISHETWWILDCGRVITPKYLGNPNPAKKNPGNVKDKWWLKCWSSFFSYYIIPKQPLVGHKVQIQLMESHHPHKSNDWIKRTEAFQLKSLCFFQAWVMEISTICVFCGIMCQLVDIDIEHSEVLLTVWMWKLQHLHDVVLLQHSTINIQITVQCCF